MKIRLDKVFKVGIDFLSLGNYNIRMKVKEVISLIKEDGWYLKEQKGSHRQFKHPNKTGRVTIAGKDSDDMPIGTLKSVLKQAQLEDKL